MDSRDGLEEAEIMDLGLESHEALTPASEEGNPVDEKVFSEGPRAVENKPGFWVKWVAVGVICALIGGATGGWVAWLLWQRTETTGPGERPVDVNANNSVIIPASGSTDEEKNTVSIVASVLPGVVQVRVKASFSHPGVAEQLQPIQASGSGFVYDPRGYIVTNEHVVSGGSEVEVVFPNGKSYQGKVVGSDRLSDLAVIKIIDPPTGLTVLPLADSDNVQVGQTTIAIGSPLGSVPDVGFGLNKAPTVTKGIVSAVDRTMPVMSKKDPQVREFQVDHLIQTDAPINYGNSGGPLLNSRGEVIGVNTAIAPETQGIGFAIPGNIVRKVAETLLQEGKVSRPYMGITFNDIANIRPMLENKFNLPEEEGALVMTVEPGSPAEKAGLHGTDARIFALDNDKKVAPGDLGDIIIAINGRPVNGDSLAEEVLRFRVGEGVRISFYRDGQKKEVSLILGSRSDR
ncbi:MAG: S1C family serine protease [Bacillota bacterium]